MQDSQGTLDEAGEDEIEETKSRLKNWTACSSHQSLRALRKALDIINSIDRRRTFWASSHSSTSNFEPNEVVSFFLANLDNAQTEGKKQLEKDLAEESNDADPIFRQVLRTAIVAINTENNGLAVGEENMRTGMQKNNVQPSS